jgi:hypothetical protein
VTAQPKKLCPRCRHCPRCRRYETAIFVIDNVQISQVIVNVNPQSCL